MDFQTAADLLLSIDVVFGQDDEWRGEVGKDRGSVKLPLFKSVKIPFTPEEWCSTGMREAEHYLGGCCGDLSAVQDEWDNVFRMGSGWVNIDKLAEIAEMLGRHDGFESWTPKLTDADIQERAKGFATMPPWDKVELLWQIVREHFRPTVPFAALDHIKGAERPISVLSRALDAMDMHLFSERMDQQEEERQFPEPRDDRDRKEHADLRRFWQKRASQSKARKTKLLYRIIPALNELQATIASLGLEPFEGWAIWDKVEKDVAKSRMGQCFYEDRAHIDELFTLWRKDEAEHIDRGPGYEPVDSRLTIRPVRITVEKGVEFLD